MNTDFFIDEIHANPFAHDPRMIFADWLEEHGDSRALSVREFWKHIHKTDSFRRNHVLQNNNLEPLPHLKNIHWGDCIGGFPTGVAAKSVDVLKRNLGKIQKSIDLKHIRIDSSINERARGSWPSGYFGAGEIAKLADIVEAHQVIWLDVDFLQLRKSDRTFIIGSDKLRSLKRFSALGSNWSFNELDALLKAETHAGLQKIRVGKGRFTKLLRKQLGDRVISSKKLIFPTRFWFKQRNPPIRKAAMAEPAPNDAAQTSTFLSRLWDKLYWG